MNLAVFKRFLQLLDRKSALLFTWPHFFFLNLVHYNGHNDVGSSRPPDIVHDAHLGPKRTFQELLAR